MAMLKNPRTVRCWYEVHATDDDAENYAFADAAGYVMQIDDYAAARRLADDLRKWYPYARLVRCEVKREMVPR